MCHKMGISSPACPPLPPPPHTHTHTPIDKMYGFDVTFLYNCVSHLFDLFFHQMLREAKEAAEAAAKIEEEQKEMEKVHFGILFDNYQGLYCGHKQVTI